MSMACGKGEKAVPHSLKGKRRILVVGSSGAGKSTLARQLGQALGLPVIHLDQLYLSLIHIYISQHGGECHFFQRHSGNGGLSNVR